MSPSLDPLRAALGQPKRKLGWFEAPPIDLRKPSFLEAVSPKSDPMVGLFSDLKEVWLHGEVRWGHVLKANFEIYQPGDEGRMGELVFSLNAPDEAAREALPDYCDRLWELADEDDLDEREAMWAEDMENDASYHAGFKLPEDWLPAGQEFRASTAYFHRPHLPDGRLASKLLPVLVLPWAPFWAVIVPCSFWPAELRAWIEAQARPEPTAPPPLPGRREEREAAYIRVFGPIGQVYHEIVPSAHHIDVYSFARSDGERPFYTLATGGMSDAAQSNVSDPVMARVELILHTRQATPTLAELLRMMAHYPFETGNALEGWHTTPLGRMAEQVLGSARFPYLFFLAAMLSADNALVGAVRWGENPLSPLMVIPLTEAEFAFLEKHGPPALLQRFKERSIAPIYDPTRKCAAS